MLCLSRAALSAAAIVALVMGATPSRAQDYPNRVVQLVNPTLAGSTTDVLARVLANGLASRLGQQFIIVNRAGAGGAIGTASVARADADGYTLWFGAVYVLSVLTKLKTTEAGYGSDALVADLPDRLERDGGGGARGLSVQDARRSRDGGARQPRQAHLRPPGRGLDSQSSDGGISRGCRTEDRGHSVPRRSGGHHRRCSAATSTSRRWSRAPPRPRATSCAFWASSRRSGIRSFPGRADRQGAGLRRCSRQLRWPDGSEGNARGRTRQTGRQPARARRRTRRMQLRPAEAASRQRTMPTG